MLLIGMLDSPFVRRVAISLKLLGRPFEHRAWSVGADQARIREHNPLGRVPALVLDEGETLIESAAILDWLDEQVGPGRALLPPGGASRRRGLRLMAYATGAAEKGVAQLYECAFRPPDKRHPPWVARCHDQMEGALALLEAEAARLEPGAWLLGPRLAQADITAACAYTFLQDALALDPAQRPALAGLAARCEALPAFQETRLPFFPPAG